MNNVNTLNEPSVQNITQYYQLTRFDNSVWPISYNLFLMSKLCILHAL